MVEPPVLDPPLAILAGLFAALLVYVFMAKYTTGMLWPRGRIDCNTWWRWSLSLVAAFAAYAAFAPLLGPSKADIEPCKTLWEQVPDPWGPWLLVHAAVTVAFLAFIAIAVLAKDRGC